MAANSVSTHVLAATYRSKALHGHVTPETATSERLSNRQTKPSRSTATMRRCCSDTTAGNSPRIDPVQAGCHGCAGYVNPPDTLMQGRGIQIASVDLDVGQLRHAFHSLRSCHTSLLRRFGRPVITGVPGSSPTPDGVDPGRDPWWLMCPSAAHYPQHQSGFRVSHRVLHRIERGR
jgi:hypothetical protein